MSDIKVNYDDIAQAFTKSRRTRWTQVEEFVNLLPNGKILDAGCGGGNHMFNRPGGSVHEWYGCDVSQELVKICQDQSLNVCVADVCFMPYTDNQFDAITCIAVIHHLPTAELRKKAVMELLRVLKPGGKILISVLREACFMYFKKIKFIDSHNVDIPFQGHSRYYHIFQENEFETLIKDIENITIDCTLEKMNYYYMIQKRVAP